MSLDVAYITSLRFEPELNVVDVTDVFWMDRL